MSKKPDKHEVGRSKGSSRLARRARSFKEDILGKIHQMRTPSRAASPQQTHKARPRARDNELDAPNTNPASPASSPSKGDSQVNNDMKQISNALRYFQDSVEKNTLGHLPGSASIVLEYVLHLISLLKKDLINDQSSVLMSTTNQVYQSLSRFIEWADDVMLNRERATMEGVNQVVQSLQDSLKALIEVSQKQSQNKDKNKHMGTTTPNGIYTSKADRSQLDGSSLDAVAPPLPPKKKSGALSSNSNLLEPLSAVLRSPLFGDWQGSSTLSGASSFESCLHHSADDLLGISSPAAWTATTHKTSYQSFSYNACTTTVSGRSDSVDQLLSHSSSSTHISAMKQVDKTLASVSHQSFELTGSAFGTSVDEIKPALPIKQRSARTRTPSQYDNVSDAEDVADGERWKSEHWHTTDMMGCKVIGHEPSCPQHGQLTNASSTNISAAAEDGRPPPLPPKKKMIQEYIQTFGSYSQPAEQQDFFNSGRLFTYQAAHYKQVQMSFASLGSDEFLSSSLLDATLAAPFELSSPPALPPKKNRSSSLGVQDSLMLPTRQSYASLGSGTCLDTPQPLKAIEDALPDENGESLIDLQDVSDHLIFGDNPNDVRGLKGGPADALIIHATAVPENSEKEYFYQEAFLTTYKTFVSPMDLVNKLIYRYNKFIQFSDTRQKYARWAFSLLVRVVDDLGLSDAGPDMVRCLTAFSHQLVGRGDLSLARALRAKVVEKWEAHAQLHAGGPWSTTGAGGAPPGCGGSLANLRVTTQPATLLQFKSELLAEQMTLLDAHLFQRIDISEILIWAKEQNEDSSPNLTKFTEHFNKMSYWARSCILKQCDAKDRERVVVKFIKIMKHLRKINNFNSYLAILSALDSAPIRRLEWQKNITEGLKEYCALIDSSSSFRAYRQALAETTPPCIPYIGLILQDLTFVHVGNTDYITDSIVNFTKCWQQFHILEPMRCFKKKPFSFKRNEQIIDFFNNFEDYLSEDAMWEISENIKPRAGQKKKDYS
ncbi:rap guanine nucleotide exchange factor 1-like isoform X3 [Dermacentor andersoni]|uniref:rap guanine nucleotide exchange factor 1-like isoform X3 n=1 Tax=Dermacentor andersoni TaxID=34620 RepID=UPI0024180659|nr:guanine nucleotide-releasing factor 2-like isoform X3 [Dermacentor andersoni]